MSRFSYAPGSALALLAAGPIFMLLLLAGAAILGPSFLRSGWQMLAQGLAFAVIAIPFGMAIGGIPIVLGGYVMGRLGCGWPSARHSLLWAVVGAIIGVAISALIFGNIRESHALFAITGAICALIVRYGTRWSGDASA